MNHLEKRKTQTEVKHEILENYLHRWGYIINQGLRSLYDKAVTTGRDIRVRFVYVDCFAYKGKYADERESQDPVYGSAIIGIRALKAIQDNAVNNTGFTPEIMTILIEKERENYDVLLNTLDEAGYTDRVRRADKIDGFRREEIVVIHGDSHDYVNELLQVTNQDYTWSFYLLDPFGPSGIPLNVVAPIITQSRADVMINLIYQDLHKKTGSVIKDTPTHKRHLQYYDKVYGDSSWRHLVLECADDAEKDRLESTLIDKYKGVLEKLDEGLAVKTIRLKFPDKERTMLYLFLTTHDPNGAITLNEILDNANRREFELREEHRNVVKKAGQMSLFTLLEEDPGSPQLAEPDIDYVADLVYSRCKGEEMGFREVLRRMIDEPYYLSVIKKAMTSLKKKKLAIYDKLESNKTMISFK